MFKKSVTCLFNSNCMPILQYGSETYTWFKADSSRLTAAERMDRKPEKERVRTEKELE
jgi:hypothetical protein